MSYTFQVYLAEDREYFIYGRQDRKKKVNFAFSQTLLDLLDLDLESQEELFVGMRKAIQILHLPAEERRDEQDQIALIRQGLNAPSSQHVYFELLKLEWEERLDKYQTGDYKSRVDLLPVKEISHIPANIQTIQEQIQRLILQVLDLSSPQEKSVQVKMAEYYRRSRSSLDSFSFGPLPVSFEVVDEIGFTDVLKPGSIYDIIDFFLREWIKREQLFKVCKNCNRYFPITGYTNTEYCDRLYKDTGKACKEIGATEAYKRKVQTNPVVKEYNREYKKRFAWIRYRKITQEAFYEWSKKAQAMRDKALAKEISLEEFKAWLKE